MKFIHSEEVLAKFPDNYTCIIGNVLNIDYEKLSEITHNLLTSSEQNNDHTNEIISTWKNIFVNMGAKPKYHSSLEALKRYYDEKKELYKITPIVDFYNAYSLSNGIPMAAYDEEKIEEELILKEASKGELFTPLGNPNQIEKTKNKEIVYADKHKIICRYWNLQDCDATKITPETKKVIFIFDLVNAELKSAENKYQKIMSDFKIYFGETIFHGITGNKLNKRLEWE